MERSLFTIHIILLLLGWLSSTSGTDCPNYCYDIGDGGPLCNKNQECYFCADGLYGKSCDQPCSVIPNCYHCFNKSELHCAQCTAGWCSTNCTKQCDPRCRTCNILNSTACIDCKPQFYGYNCKEDCSINCKKNECHDDTGECVDGCNPGPTCTDGRCQDGDGECSGGCISGWHGRFCNLPCSGNCKNDSCSQENGECKGGCVAGFTGIYCTEEPVDLRTILLIVGTVLVLVFGACVFIACMIYRHRRSQSHNQDPVEDANNADYDTTNSSE